MIKLQIKVVTLWPEGVDEELGRGGGGGVGGKGDRNINETSSHCPHSLNCMSTKICLP